MIVLCPEFNHDQTKTLFFKPLKDIYNVLNDANIKHILKPK